MLENKFYVYVYLDIRKPGKYQYGEYFFNYEPFYVGKGYGNRYKIHLLKAKRYLNNKNKQIHNLYKINKINSILKDGKEPLILIYKNNLTEQESFELEKRIINEIKIKEMGGPLTNITMGGSGSSNEVISNKKCIELCEWIINNGRLPTGSKKNSKEEKNLFHWLSRKKSAIQGLNDRIFYESDQKIANCYGLKDLFKIETFEQKSNKMCIELCEFIKYNNRTPLYKNGSKERQLNLWLKTRKVAKKFNHGIFYESDQKIANSYNLNNLFVIR